MPEGTDLTASSFVFTTSGEIAGLVVREPTGLAIVPWEVVREEATRILNGERTPAVDLRMEVRPLTAALTTATGASQGVVVAWVDSRDNDTLTRTCREIKAAVNGQTSMEVHGWRPFTIEKPGRLFTHHLPRHDRQARRRARRGRRSPDG